MEAAPLPDGDDLPLKVPAIEVVDLTSGDGVHASLPVEVTQAGESGSEDDEEGSDDQWEDESLFEDALEGMGDEQLLSRDGSDTCTLDEAMAFRRRLHKIGIEEFVEETLNAGTITAKKLCTAFGIMPPAFLEGCRDEAYHQLLVLGINREMNKRLKLNEYNSVEDAVELLKKSRNIIVLTGAGISTSLGIPDFRSKDTGLYSKLEGLGLSDPQEVFDIQQFRQDPSIFYSVAKDILPTTTRHTPTHEFIRLLQDKGKLLTNYTQNIDNIESHAGISPEKLIQCHGSFATATCIECGHKVPGEDIYPDIRKGVVPSCQRCSTVLLQAKSQPMKRKRSSNGDQKKRRKGEFDDDSDNSDDYTLATAGIMKPDITFFGEDLPQTFHDRLVDHDRQKADLVIVIGTSLKVAPVAEVPSFLPSDTPQIYISKTRCAHIDFDIEMNGDCDVVVAELCRRAGWDLKHEMLPEDQIAQVEQLEGFRHRHLFSLFPKKA